jgi:hypothetical protein
MLRDYRSWLLKIRAALFFGQPLLLIYWFVSFTATFRCVVLVTCMDFAWIQTFRRTNMPTFQCVLWAGLQADIIHEHGGNAIQTIIGGAEIQPDGLAGVPSQCCPRNLH